MQPWDTHMCQWSQTIPLTDSCQQSQTKHFCNMPTKGEKELVSVNNAGFKMWSVSLEMFHEKGNTFCRSQGYKQCILERNITLITRNVLRVPLIFKCLQWSASLLTGWVAASRTSSGPGLIAGKDPHAYLGCRVLPLVRLQQWEDHFRCFDLSLYCDKS